MNAKLFLASLTAAAGATAGAQSPPPAAPPAKPPLTQDGGQPVGNNQNSRAAGDRGPVLLDDFHLLEKLARFDRERIPERVVHARGVGAHGEFTPTADIAKLTKAKVFTPGKSTPVFVRFSTVIHPSGSPESLRDPRGFSVKFYTEEGNWDLVGNNLPVFFIRDAIKFPDLIHSLKPSPVTNQQDPNRFFDFFSHVPESTHMLTFLYSDQGTPSSLRKMDGFGVHAFKLVNAAGEVTYVKFNWRSMQGQVPATNEEAVAAAAKNHSFHTADLYDAIKAGQYPSWELRIQTMAPGDLEKFEFDPLDDTKIWPGIPETTIGKMTLNRVPENFFQFTEQAAFSPGMFVPGIEASEDRMLQGRLFSYSDTQRYRIGANYLDVPVNRPVAPRSNNNQDGKLNQNVTKGDVNYEPSVTTGGRRDDPAMEATKAPLSGTVTARATAKPLNFKQAGELYRSFTEPQRANLIKNLAGDLGKVANDKVKLQMISHFDQADKEFGERIAKAVNADIAAARALPVALDAATKTKLLAVAFDAARTGDAVTLTRFFAAKQPVNEVNERGDTLLAVAAYHGHADAVKVILAQPGVAIDARTKMGLTALAAAAFHGHVDVAKLLVAKKADVNAANDSGQTPLMFAALTGRSEMVKYLLDAGAKAYAADKAGNTAATLAAGQGAADVAKLLK